MTEKNNTPTQTGPQAPGGCSNGLPATPAWDNGTWRTPPTRTQVTEWFTGRKTATGKIPEGHYSLGETDETLGEKLGTTLEALGEHFAELQHGCRWRYDPDYDAGVRLDVAHDEDDRNRYLRDSLPVLLEVGPATVEACMLAYQQGEEEEDEWTEARRNAVLAHIATWRQMLSRLERTLPEAQPEEPEDPDDNDESYEPPTLDDAL